METSIRRFENLNIRNFRRLADVDLPLRPLTVMIGANGVGKTSILDALSLLASSAQGRLNAGISENSGLSAMRTFGRDADIEFGISMAEPENHPLDYALNLRPRGGSYVISRETLSQGRDLSLRIDAHDIDVMYYHEGRIVRPNWEHNPLESSLSQVPKMFRTPEGFREQLASCTFHHGINVEPRSPVRLPQAMRPAPLPGKNGEDLVSCLYYLRETDPDRFEAVEDALKSAFPSFRKLDFPPVAAGTLGDDLARQEFRSALVYSSTFRGYAALSLDCDPSAEPWTHCSDAH